MKKYARFFKTLKFFSFAAAIFVCALAALLLFASCENMGGDAASYDALLLAAAGQKGASNSAGGNGPSGGQTAGGQATVEGALTASVRLPGLPSLAGIAPLSDNAARYAGLSTAPASNDSAQASDGISKSAFPNIADAAGTAYSFSATLSQSGTGGATYSADGTYDSVTGKCSFSFAGAQSASEQSYTLTVELYHASGTPAVKSLVAGGSQSVTVEAAAVTFSASVQLDPNLESGAPNGSLKLPIKFSDTSVASVQLKLVDSGNNDVTATYLDGVTGTPLALPLDSSGSGTIQSKDGGLPPGTYSLLMTFENGGQKLGFRTESLNVYPTMETSLWWTNGSDPAATLSVTKFVQKEFWVRGTGGDFYANVYTAATAIALDTNIGSFAFPLKTVQEAVKRIKDNGDEATQYTIIVDGKVTGEADADYSAQNDAYINIACDRMITIKGWSGADKDIIDANKSAGASNPARALYIKSSKKIVLQKIAVTGGYLSGTLASTTDGGGIFIAGATTEVELDNCVIEKNDAQKNGGGICLFDSGTLTMNGSSSLIKSNRLLSNVSSIYFDKKACGGGVYVGQGATFTMNAGTIRENVLPITTSGGGGIYVLGTFDMKGGTVSSNGLRKEVGSYDLAAVKNIEVCSQGTFNLYDGTITKDIDTTNYESCAGVILYASMNQDYPEGKATFNMSGGSICGLSSTGGGGVRMNASGTDRSCEFNMSGGTISGNTSTYIADTVASSNNGCGGGVYVGTNCVFNFTGGTISGNTAIYTSDYSNSGKGGGIYIAGSTSKCYISGSAVIGQNLASTSSAATAADGSHSNKAKYGGGIYNAGELYLGYTDSSTPAVWTGSVCYNYATDDGGGIFSSGSDAVFKMNSGNVAYNLCSDGIETTGGGGGVAVQNSSAFTMSGGTVSYNQTNNKVGGGIYVDSGATLTLNGTAEVSSNKTSPDGTGSMGGAGLFAYRASITMEGNAVVKDNLCKACGGGVYLFEFEDASGYASLAMSGNAKILENTSSDGLGGAVYVTQRCSFSMSGAATIPVGVAGTTGAGKNDVYLDENTSVAVPAAITSTATPVAAITPKSPYAVGATVLTGTALIAAECAKFELTQPAGVEFPWTIEYDSTNGGVLKHDRNVFYVADYGNNTSGDGTKDNPYETIKFALTKFTDKMPASVDFKNKIYVLTDMTYDAGLGSDVPCYYEIVGCNGGTLGNNVTFTFNTPGDSGLYVAYGQKIKLTHIDITQSSATANNYAAILVENSSTNGVGELWMEDSSIKNMYANACSAIAAKGDVHLKNVEISGNKTVANTSGATPFGPAINSTTGTVSVLGKVVIKDNQMQINTAAAGDPPSYVYKEQNLWIGENTGAAPAFHPLDILGVLTGSDIGVTLFDYGTLYTTFTSGFASAGISAPSDVFASDDGMSVIKNISSGEAIMTAPTSLYVWQTGNDFIGNGSRLAPFATIQKALDKINALDTSGISYTIYVRGTVKGYAEIPDGVKAAKITIDKDPSSIVTNTLDGVGKASPVLTINAAIPVNISNLTITRGSRGVDIEKSATVKITDCVITLNDATGKTNIAGAGIYVPENSAITPSLTITGGEVSSNTATGLGGGIYFGAGTLTIENVEISGNEATGTNKNGGGLYVGGTGGYVSGFTMTGGSIDGNTSSTDGGGATINCKQSANALLDGVTISGNTASAGNGGGIAITSGKYLSVKDCIIINNTATGGNGGGIYNAGTCYIYGSTAIGEEGASSPAESGASKHSNLAGGNGGGIYNASTLHFGYYNDKSVTPAQVKPDTGFSGGVWYNYAADMGGGVFNAGTMMMSKGQIVRNGSKYGAGVANVDATATFASGSLTYNSASTGGGGIFNKKSDPADTTTSSVVNLNGIHVVGNTVSPTGGGGGVMNQYGTLNFTSGQINFNSGGQYGGGVLTLGPVFITGGSIQNNSAILGGGIYVYQDTVEMSGGTISANTANVDASATHPDETGHGGGVYIYNGTLKMSSGTISGNTAKGGKGGAVYVANDASTYTGNFVISGDASIPLGTTNNDVFLCNAITIDGNLTATAPVATITPSIYDASAQVLIDGAGTVAGNYDKIAVTPQTISGGSTKNWTVNSSGYLAELTTGGGSITIHTPEGDLNLAASATTITTSASDTTVTVSATDASGSAITSGLAWNGVTVYYGADEIDTGAGNSYKFKKTFPKGTYTLNVSVTYNGTTYSDSFTIKKTVEGYVAQPNVFDGEATLCADDADRKSSVFIKDRPITISATLWACDHETTQGEYETYCFYGSTSPSSDYGIGENYPAYYVSWYDAIVYCNLRSIAEGKTACYKLGSSSDPKTWSGIVAGTGANAGKYCGPSSSNSDWNGITCDFEASGYRLPTEAEWEYLARGKNLTNDGQTIYSGSDTVGAVAWYSENASSKTHEVKGMTENVKGLYDMSGNVQESCWDWYADINASTPATGASSGSYRVRRGGSWYDGAGYCSVAYRNYGSPNYRGINLGFRVVRNAP